MADTRPPADTTELQAGDSVNAPDLSESSPKRSISSAEQAWNIARRLEKDRETPNKVNAQVERNYKGKRPYDPGTMTGASQSWRSNFSSLAMKSIIDKCIPNAIALLNSMRYLTASQLPATYENAQEKSDKFRDRITKAIRGWEEWDTFEWELWREVILHGGGIAMHINRYSPWPKFYRLHEAFVPSFTGQNSKGVQVIAAMEDRLLHDFVEQVANKNHARAAGWDIDKAFEALKKAMPVKASASGISKGDVRTYEDVIAEGNLGNTIEGAKAVKMYHVLAVEPETKKVSYYGLNREGEHEALIHKDDAFDSMESTVALFALTPGTFYGSIGLGKTIVNACIALERNRNRMMDQLRLAGLMVVKTDATKSPTLQMRVMHPFILAATDGTIEQQQLQANIESFIDTDNQLLRWIEQAAGAYISDLRGPDENPTTATEEQIRQRNQSQQQAAFLARAASQHAKLVANIQKRLLDPDTLDDTAKEVQRALKEDDGLSEVEIKYLRDCPVAEVVEGPIEARNAKVIAAGAALKGDPNFDQYILSNQVATAMVDPVFTKDVMLPEASVQANEIEGSRQQLQENEAMIAGAPMPVSPRDMHPAHLKVMFGEMRQGIPSVVQGDPKVMDAMNLMLHHGDAHIQEMDKAGAKPAETKPYRDNLKAFDELLKKTGEHYAKQAALQQQGPPPGTMAVPHGPGSMSGEIAPGVGAPVPQGQPAQPMEPASAADLVKMYVAPETPAEIKVQIEEKIGLTPSTVEQHQAAAALAAVEKHPSLPSKVGSNSAPPAGPPATPLDRGAMMGNNSP